MERSKILSFYGKIQVRKNLYSGIFNAMFLNIRKKVKLQLLKIKFHKSKTRIKRLKSKKKHNIVTTVPYMLTVNVFLIAETSPGVIEVLLE